MTSPAIFLDLDGVVADLRGGIAELLGIPHPYEGRPAADASEPAAAFEALLCRPEPWEKVAAAGVEFWATLKPYPWTADLLAMLRRQGSVVVCTAPGRALFAAHACAGKHRWAERNLGLSSSRIILINQKSLLAGRGRTLIDDSDNQIDPWRKANGRGILLPQPWNTARGLVDIDPVMWIEEAMKGVEQAA